MKTPRKTFATIAVAVVCAVLTSTAQASLQLKVTFLEQETAASTNDALSDLCLLELIGFGSVEITNIKFTTRGTSALLVVVPEASSLLVWLLISGSGLAALRWSRRR